MFQKNIYQAIKKQAIKTPRATAVGVVGGGIFTFENFIARVDNLRNKIDSLKIKKNDRVLIVLPNRLDLLTAFLATTSRAAGAIINPDSTIEEMEFFLSDLKPRAVIVNKKKSGAIAALAKRFKIPLIFFSSEKIERNKGIKKSGLPRNQEAALILYTSGTTAQPKMVPLNHRNILSSADNIIKALKLTEADCCLNFMPLFHIHGLMVALASLINGNSVFLSKFDRHSFSGDFNNFKPTWYTATPTIHQAILSAAKANRRFFKNLKLRFIRSSSAPLPKKTTRDLEKIFQAPVSESYGMTEAALQITANPLPPARRKSGSVGRPFGTKIAVLDEKGKFLPPKKTGEIVIKGKNVFNGYGNNLKINQQSFFKNWFRTGDWGYLDSDGFLFIKGRIKEIINKGGEKISPREIDEAILKHPLVQEAAAFAAPHPTLRESVMAAVVPEDKRRLDENILKKFLAPKLSQFKIPDRILIVDEIPRGPGGKIKRGDLYREFKRLLAPGGQKQKPLNKTEKDMMKIWQKVLGRKTIGRDDNFFAVGGDSLRAARLIANLNSTCKKRFSPAVIYKAPTPKGLLLLYNKKGRASDG